MNNCGGMLFFNPPYRRLGKCPTSDDMTSQIPIVPLGASSLFAYVSAYAGIPCNFYYAPDHSLVAIRSVIRRLKPRMVALSCNAYNRFSCLMIAQITKDFDPSIQVIFGGVHPTFLDVQMLTHYSFVDYVVRGEGEVTIVELVKALQGSGDVQKIDGLSFRQGKRIVRNKARARLTSLNDIPLLDYEYFLSQGVKNDGLRCYAARAFPVETSRGCPFSCSFCTTVGMWGRKMALRSVDQVIEQIRCIPRSHEHLILFHDMNFTLNKDYVRQLCRALKDNGINMPWHCCTRLDLVDEDILKIMKDAGCIVIFFGIESLSDTILKRIHKGFTAQKAIESIRLTASLGIKVRLSFIIGLPGETEETLKESMSNCRRLGLGVEAHINHLLVVPGTEVYDLALKEGFDELYWLKDHVDAIPYYEGAMPRSVLKKWEEVFNSFQMSDLNINAKEGIDDVIRAFYRKKDGRKRGIAASRRD